MPDEHTLTITIQGTTLQVLDETGNATGEFKVRRKKKIQWKGDNTVLRWVVGIQGEESPFRKNVRLFSAVGTDSDGEWARGDAAESYCFFVFAVSKETGNAHFLDPKLIFSSDGLRLPDHLAYHIESLLDMESQTNQLAAETEDLRFRLQDALAGSAPTPPE